MPLPDVAERAQRIAGVEPPGGLVDAHGVEVRHLRELLGDVAVAADHAAAVAQHAHDAAVLPVALFLLVGEFELPQQVVAHRADVAGLPDLRHEARPGTLFQFVQQRRLRFSVFVAIIVVTPYARDFQRACLSPPPRKCASGRYSRCAHLPNGTSTTSIGTAIARWTMYRT